MKPDQESSRSFALMLAHRAVRDIRRDGFRQLRNYVDMCALLAHRPDLKKFFDRAQKILQRTDSLYYQLIHSLLERVREEAICTAGVNLGFDALISCASNNRRQGGGTGSWFNAGLCSAPGLEQAVAAAEQDSSYAWVLYSDGDVPEQTEQLLRRHPNSIFFILVDPQALCPETVQHFAACPNAVTLLYLHQPELTPETCRAARELRSRQMFYGFLVELDGQTASHAIDPDWLDVLAQYGLFCIYARKPGMKAETSEELYREIVRSRTETAAVPMLLLDWERDMEYISSRVTPGTAPNVCLSEGRVFPLSLG